MRRILRSDCHWHVVQPIASNVSSASHGNSFTYPARSVGDENSTVAEDPSELNLVALSFGDCEDGSGFSIGCKLGCADGLEDGCEPGCVLGDAEG